MTPGREEPPTSIPNYRAYLVRIWRDSEQAPWRATVTFVQTGEVRKFADPQMVWAFIQLQLEMPGVAESGADLD